MLHTYQEPMKEQNHSDNGSDGDPTATLYFLYNHTHTYILIVFDYCLQYGILFNLFLLYGCFGNKYKQTNKQCDLTRC